MTINQFNPAYAGAYTPQQGGAPMTAAQPYQPTNAGFGSMQFNNLGRFMNQVPNMYAGAMAPYQTGGGQMLGDTTGFYQQLEGALGSPQQNLRSAFSSYQSMLSGMVPAMQAAQQEQNAFYAPRTAAMNNALQYAQGQLGTGYGNLMSQMLREVRQDVGNRRGSLLGENSIYETAALGAERQMNALMAQQAAYNQAIQQWNLPSGWAEQSGNAFAQGANMFGSQMANNVLTPQNYLGLAGQFAQQNAQNRMAPWQQAMGMMGQGNVYGGGSIADDGTPNPYVGLGSLKKPQPNNLIPGITV